MSNPSDPLDGSGSPRIDHPRSRSASGACAPISPREANGTISTFSAGHESPQMIIAEGDADSQQIWRPTARWMSREDYNQWRQEVTQIIEAQREACEERGEGCPHISRFEPSYARPRQASLAHWRCRFWNGSFNTKMRLGQSACPNDSFNNMYFP